MCFLVILSLGKVSSVCVSRLLVIGLSSVIVWCLVVCVLKVFICVFSMWVLLRLVVVYISSGSLL